MLVKDVMTSPAITVSAEAWVKDGLRLLDEHPWHLLLRALIVVSAGAPETGSNGPSGARPTAAFGPCVRTRDESPRGRVTAGTRPRSRAGGRWG